MGDKQREALALRAIAVSGRAALNKTTHPEEVARIADRVDDLLAELESIVIRDGGDEQILAAIEAERRRLRQ
jgi:hypothetical protein